MGTLRVGERALRGVSDPVQTHYELRGGSVLQADRLARLIERGDDASGHLAGDASVQGERRFRLAHGCGRGLQRGAELSKKRLQPRIERRGDLLRVRRSLLYRAQ